MDWESDDAIGFPKITEEHGKIQTQNGKTTCHEIMKDNSFKGTLEEIIFSFTRAPLDYSLTLEKTHILQFLHNCLRHFTFAPARREICNCFILDLGLVLFGSHLCVTSSGSRDMRGVSGCHKQLENANLNLTVAGVKRIKTLEVTARVYMVSDGNIVNT
jgi:hypothetical protein